MKAFTVAAAVLALLFGWHEVRGTGLALRHMEEQVAGQDTPIVELCYNEIHALIYKGAFDDPTTDMNAATEECYARRGAATYPPNFFHLYSGAASGAKALQLRDDLIQDITARRWVAEGHSAMWTPLLSVSWLFAG
jgi:hypothetical protein